jgi:PAS domain S-box-containing protein
VIRTTGDPLWILDSLREGVQVIDDDLRYVYLNRAAAEHGHTTVDALRGRTMTECYPGIEQTEMFALLVGCLRERRSGRMLNEFTYPDGRIAWFDLRFEPCAEGVVVLSHDITEARALEAELQRARRLEALGRLASGVAHDFNNVLTVVLGSAAFLKEHVADGSRGQRHLASLQEGAARGARLTTQLLDYAQGRARAGESAEASRIAGGVADMLAVVLGQRITLRRSLAPDLPLVDISPGALEQVLMNLLFNAQQAVVGLDQAEILVETALAAPPGGAAAEDAAAAWVRIRVVDSGPGVPPELLDRVFEPFFTTRREVGGTGLGLATCQGLVERAGGRIILTSVPGRTEFAVYLRVCARHDAPVAAPSSSVRPGGRILLVEADQSVLDVARQSLERVGYEVVIALTADDALQHLRDATFDLLVADSALPGPAGPGLAAQAAVLQPGLRALLLGARVDDQPAVEGTSGPDFLEKPFGPEELAHRVRGIFGG